MVALSYIMTGITGVLLGVLGSLITIAIKNKIEAKKKQ